MQYMDLRSVIGIGLLLVVMGTLFGLYTLGGRRQRDPRLDRTWSDDEPAPYDSAASLNPRMDQYMRMLDDEDAPKY
jgi:hypothetical protein